VKQVLSKGTSVVLITSLTLTRLWTYIYKCGSALRESEEKAKHTHCHTDKQTGEERTEEGRREKGSEQRQITFFFPFTFFLGYSSENTTECRAAPGMALGVAGVAALLSLSVFTGATADTNSDDGSRFMLP